MLTFDYLKRLGLHGSRLLWRVFMILVPVIGYSFWQAFKEMTLPRFDVHQVMQPNGCSPMPLG